MRKTSEDALWAAGLFLLAACVYLSFLSQAYVFEGLARAMPIELGLWRRLCPGNYILYGPLGFAFHHLLGLFAAAGLAVRSLQIMDALLGAAGLAVFFLSLRALGARRAAAAAWAAVLGACLAYWLWSSDAQDYILSTFLLALQWLFLCRELSGRRHKPEALGLLGALAVFGHVVNVLSWPAALWCLRRRGRGAQARWAAAALAATAAGYAAALLVSRPASAWSWFLNSAAGSGGGVHWHGGFWSAQSLGQWLRMSGRIFVSASGVLGRAAAAAAAACAVVALSGLRRLSGARREAAVACGLWLAAYAALFISWEPYTMVYRVSDLVPLVVLLSLGWGGAAWSGGALAALLAAANFSSKIYPRSFAGDNPELQRMLFVKAHTEPSAWVTGDGGEDELYLPYFAERRPLVLGQFQADLPALARRVNELLAQGQPVYATSSALAEPRWAAFFRRWKASGAGNDGTGFALYRLSASR